MQLELFKPGRRLRRRRNRIRRRIDALVGNGADRYRPDEETEPSNSKNFAELISQLEESKFVRLFRHLADLNHHIGFSGADSGKPVEPLGLPEAELHFKLAGSMGSFGSYSVAWLFQIAHAPAFLWHDEFAENFFRERLGQAFANLAKRWPEIQKTEPSLGPHTLFRAASEGCDQYYLFTNICHDITENALERFSDTAHSLFSEIVGAPRDRHPSFGIGTPESVVSKANREARRFVIDLLNMPSSYYFVAREGRISVAAVTEHGGFMASPEARKVAPMTGLSTVATSVLAVESSVSLTSLRDLEVLINSRTTLEQDLQDFFIKNPGFLFGLDERYCEIRPHVCLYDAKGERLVPDFMARIQDSDIWDTIELKLPRSSTAARSQLTGKASAAAARGIAELLTYRDFFSTRTNRNRIASRFGTAPYEPCLVLVIGRGPHTWRHEWRSTRAGFPKVQVVSYDYVFERAKQLRRKWSSSSGSSKSQIE